MLTLSSRRRRPAPLEEPSVQPRLLAQSVPRDAFYFLRNNAFDATDPIDSLNPNHQPPFHLSRMEALGRAHRA